MTIQIAANRTLWISLLFQIFHVHVRRFLVFILGAPFALLSCKVKKKSFTIKSRRLFLRLKFLRESTQKLVGILTILFSMFGMTQERASEQARMKWTRRQHEKLPSHKSNDEETLPSNGSCYISSITTTTKQSASLFLLLSSSGFTYEIICFAVVWMKNWIIRSEVSVQGILLTIFHGFCLLSLFSIPFQSASYLSVRLPFSLVMVLASLCAICAFNFIHFNQCFV